MPRRERDSERPNTFRVEKHTPFDGLENPAGKQICGKDGQNQDVVRGKKRIVLRMRNLQTVEGGRSVAGVESRSPFGTTEDALS